MILLVAAGCFGLGIGLFPFIPRGVGARNVELRENPADLMPFQLKRIATCIEVLKKESLDDSIGKQLHMPNADICAMMANFQAIRLAMLDSVVTSDTEIVEILCSRRFLKIVEELQTLPDSLRRAKVLLLFNEWMTHFDKVAFREFFAKSMGIPERQGLSFCLICVAEFGTQNDLLDALEKIELAQSAFIKQIEATGKYKTVGTLPTLGPFTGYRLRMNEIGRAHV